MGHHLKFQWAIILQEPPHILQMNGIQLTNWILWNGHFYHIEVIDLPYHRITFVSCFISLIENTKNNDFIEKNKQNCDNLCGSKSKFAWQSIFSFVYLVRSHVHSQELCAVQWQWKTLIKSRLRFNCAHPMVILIHWPSSNFTVPRAALCATHIHVGTCVLCKRTRNAREAMK